MSRIDPEGPSLKKQAFTTVLIGIMLIAAWYGYAMLSATIFGSNPYDVQDELGRTDNINADLDPISFPNFTIDPNAFQGFDPNNIPDWLLQALAGGAFLSGEIGGFENLEQLNSVVFRVYNESSRLVQGTDLWRYTAYDEYQGNGWARSDDANSLLGYEPQGGGVPGLSEYIIRIPFGATMQTSIASPTSFPYPRIEVNSIDAPNLLNAVAYKDSENGSTIALQMSASEAGNLSYSMFRENFANSSVLGRISVEPIYAPLSIRQKYLQIPGGLSQYRSTHPNFDYHYNLIQGYLIGNNSETTDNISTVIGQYISDTFTVDLTFPLERPGSTDDIVEWFCEGREGLPMDFAAAYVMFCRAFNVPCRYASGYNSLYGSDTTDPFYYDRICREIRFTNMYAWNEIYFTTSTDGSGAFAPMELQQSISLPGGGTNGTMDESRIMVYVNGTLSAQGMGFRGESLNLTFGLQLPFDQGVDANDSQTLSIYDHNTEQSLGSVVTDSEGYASFILNMDTNFIAGAHAISVTHSPVLRNVTLCVLVDQLNVQLVSLTPNSIDRSVSNNTIVNAFIYDPENNQRVRNAILHPLVVQGTAGIPNSCNPSDVKVDDNGAINSNEEITDIVDQGSYMFRVDFNGSYEVDNPINPLEPILFQIPMIMDTSSNMMAITITDPNQRYFFFNLNATYFSGDQFVMKRGIGHLDMNAYTEQAGSPIGGTIRVYDQTYGNYQIAAFNTNPVTGLGSMEYYMDNHWVAGPHALYAEWVETGKTNGTFFMLVNESVTIENLMFGPSVINKTGGGYTQFSISGDLWDAGANSGSGAAVRNGLVSIRLLSSYDVSPLLNPDPMLLNTGITGGFSATYGVDSITPIGNYRVRADFNGTWYTGGSPFSISSLSDSSPEQSLTITDPSLRLLEMWINGTATQTGYFSSNAPVYTRNQWVNITVRLWESGLPRSGQTITYYDDKASTTPIGTIITNGAGYATFIVQLINTFTAGLIRFRASYGTFSNYSQVYLNAAHQIYITSAPGATYLRNVDQVTIAGQVRDTANNNALKEARVRLFVRDSNGVDRTDDITTWLYGTSRNVVSTSSNGQFSFVFRFPLTYHGVYDISVEYYGEQQDSFGACGAYYDSASWDDATPDDDTIVYAGTQLTASYSPQDLLITEDVTVTGVLSYDNGTILGGKNVNITYVDAANKLCTPSSFDVEVTNGGTGAYTSIITLLWSNTNKIFAEFLTDNVNYIQGKKVQAIYSS